MLGKNELLALISDMETDRVERTTSTSDTDKFSQAVCAFANDLPGHALPGYLLIGIGDSGHPSGLKVSDELLRNLGGLRADGNIQPIPMIAVYRVQLDDGEVAVVEVHPSDLPPVRYKGQTWVRVGPRKAIATVQEERTLTERRIAAATSFDASPMREASLEDLSLAQFGAYQQTAVASDVLDANHRSHKEQLASLRFYDSRRDCPTVAGLLLFGINPRFFLPGAYIQYLRLPGTTLTDLPDEQAELSGDLLGVLRELDTRVSANIHATLEPESNLREKTAFNYPRVAVRELLLNAVMHRDYQSTTPVRFYWFADRIEIQNPGGLFGEVTRETLTTRNSYRNPVVAEAMKTLGYVNRYGYGIQRAQAALAANGNPPAAFEVDDKVFSVVLQETIR